MDHHDPQIPPHHHPNYHHHPGGSLIHPSGNPYLHPHHPHHQQQQQQQQQPTTMSNASMISPNSSHFLHNNRFPFTSVSPPPPSNKPLDPPNSGFPGDGSSELKPEGGGSGGAGGAFGVDASKKKRGRPRKYSPDGGNIALGLAPAPVSTAVVVHGDSVGSPPAEAPSSASKKHRGRPPGSGKKQLDALGNCGVGFTPHVILVNAGEDIASKIMAFSQQGPRTVCIMSANGSICNVMLRQSTNSSGTVTYEGRFEIISLIGSFVPSESGGNRVRTGGLSISVAGPDGRVVGGGVAGTLVAASPVQIIVGSFVADGKKPKYMPYVAESRMLHFGAPPPPTATISPSSHEEASSESSEDKTSVGHLNTAPGPFNNHSTQQHPHNMQQQQQQQQLYSAPMGWPNAGNSKMLHH